MRSGGLQEACVAGLGFFCCFFFKKSTIFQLLHPSASFRVRVCPAGVNVLACGRHFVMNVHFRMCECMNFFFYPSRQCVTFCLQHFCFYTYHQCFQPPYITLFLPLFSKAPIPLFPPPAAVSLSQNHFAFLTFAFFKNGFSFLLLSFCFF